ncbi:MAG: efflux RND transporter periplasmic adaptor subunit [Desulfoprunum sp.]|nr:efflux RND transporter periplasmic adaptor subunit [Desulfoprunum sp.]
MRTAIIIALVIGGIFAVFSLLPGRLGKQDTTPVYTEAKIQDLQVEINVVGELDAAQSHTLSSEILGTEGKIIYLIEDGTRVKKGDTLVKLDPLPFQKAVEGLQAEIAELKAAVQAAEQMMASEDNQVGQEIANAEYNLNVATLELKQFEEGDGPLKISMLQEERQKAQLELQRYEAFYKDLQDLKKNGFDNKSEISAAEEKVAILRDQFKEATGRFESYKKHVFPALQESAKAKKQNATLLLERTRQGGVHKVAKAQATLNQIISKVSSKETALEQAQVELAKTVIKAPFDGIVIHYETFREGEKRKPREGDSVFMNQPILYLPDISKMIVKTKVREIDLFKLSLGQKGIVQVDAYPDTVFNGDLTFIGALATSESAEPGQEKYFQVVFTLQNEDKRLRPGMTCRVSIIAQSLKQVLTVPTQVVFSDDTGDVCYVHNSWGADEKRQIKIGVQNEDFVQIVSGLQTGEKVSLVKPKAH